MRSLRHSPKELWISRYHDTAYNIIAIEPLPPQEQLYIQMKNRQRIWGIHSTMGLDEATPEGGNGFSIRTTFYNRPKSKVDTIMLQGTMEDSSETKFNLKLVFGTLNDRKWIFCHIGMAERTDFAEVLEDDNRDFTFPAGYMWRHHADHFIILDSTMSTNISENSIENVHQHRRELRAGKACWVLDCYNIHTIHPAPPVFAIRLREDTETDIELHGMWTALWLTRIRST